MITGRMFGDPGPCPVDDTPHTACTPATVGPLVSSTRMDQTVTVPLARPGWLPPPPPPPRQRTVETFSTATYRRKPKRSAR